MAHEKIGLDKLHLHPLSPSPISSGGKVSDGNAFARATIPFHRIGAMPSRCSVYLNTAHLDPFPFPCCMFVSCIIMQFAPCACVLAEPETRSMSGGPVIWRHRTVALRKRCLLGDGASGGESKRKAELEQRWGTATTATTTSCGVY